MDFACCISRFLSLTELNQRGGVVCAWLLVSRRLCQNLSIVSLACVNRLLIAASWHLDIPWLFIYHTHIVVGFSELSSEQVGCLWARLISLNALEEAVERQSLILVELKIKQAQVKVCFNVSRVNDEGPLVERLQIVEEIIRNCLRVDCRHELDAVCHRVDCINVFWVWLQNLLVDLFCLTVRSIFEQELISSFKHSRDLFICNFFGLTGCHFHYLTVISKMN